MQPRLAAAPDGDLVLGRSEAKARILNRYARGEIGLERVSVEMAALVPRRSTRPRRVFQVLAGIAAILLVPASGRRA